MCIRDRFNVEKFKTLSDIKHIPLLKKKELIFLQSIGPRLGGLLTKDIGELKRIFLSPGPIFDPEDRMDDYWGYTEAFYSVGFRPGDVVQVTFNLSLIHISSTSKDFRPYRIPIRVFP